MYITLYVIHNAPSFWKFAKTKWGGKECNHIMKSLHHDVLHKYLEQTGTGLLFQKNVGTVFFVVICMHENLTYDILILGGIK